MEIFLCLKLRRAVVNEVLIRCKNKNFMQIKDNFNFYPYKMEFFYKNVSFATN